MEAAARLAREELEQLSNMTAEYIPKQNDVKGELMKIEENVSNDVSTTLDDVEERAKRMHEIIDDQKRLLTRQLKAHKARALATVRSLQKEIQISTTNAQTFKEDVDNLCSFGKDEDVVRRTPAKWEEFNRQSQEKESSMTWSFDLSNEQVCERSLRKMLGEVIPKCPAGPTSERRTLGSHLRSVSLVYDGDKLVSGMVVLGNCLCVTHFNEPYLWLYDLELDNQKVCAIPGLQHAVGMTVTNSAEGALVIADRHSEGGRLHFVKVNRFAITHHEVGELPFRAPSRVSLSKKTGKLLIGQRRNVEFAVCTADGEILKQIKLTSENERECELLCVTEGKLKDEYAALLWNKDCRGSIMWLDDEGRKPGESYGGKEGEELERPLHMTVLPGTEGGLLVADYGSDSLLLVDRTHRPAHRLLISEDNVQAPHCLYLEEGSSRLYVACIAHSGSVEIREYSWPPQSGEDINAGNFELCVKLGKFSE